MHKKRKKTASSLSTKIKKLSKNELAELMIECSQKYPDVKRELMVRLESHKKATFEMIQEQIYKAFPSIESRNYSTSTIANKLSTILQSVEDASAEMQAKVYWASIDAAISELDAFGLNDDPLENLAMDTLESLVEMLTENASLQDMKTQVIDELMMYYISGNSGIVDFIYDKASELCSKESDYQIMIAHLKQTESSYDQGLLADWYDIIGDTDAQRKTLESKLEYGMDYWRLAQYWFDQEDRKKALGVILDGIEHGKGRKEELYEVLQNHYQQNNDYDKISKLLHQKIDRNELSLNRQSLRKDGAYQCLWDQYSKTNNYPQQKTLLELCIHVNAIDPDLYKIAEKTLNDGDWQDFESKIISNLQDRITKHQAQKASGWYGNSPYASREVSILAQIYQYKKDVDKLFDVVSGSVDLLSQYESLLLPKHAVAYLEAYNDYIENLIAARGRKNYQAALPYLKKMKQIYTKTLKQPANWKAYITNLRNSFKTLRALQDELSGM